MANNLTSTSGNNNTGDNFLNNFYKPTYTISSNTDSAIIAFFENQTSELESAKVLASSVVYTALAQGVDPLTIIDQMRNMNIDERNRFTSTFLNFNRVGTSQLGVHLPSRNNRFLQRMISPPLTSYADGSSPDRAANNARSIKFLTGTNTNGYYWIRGANNTVMQVYCDMNGSESGGNVGGWMRFDNDLVKQYGNSAINIITKDYLGNTTGGFVASNPRNGILKGVRWDLGSNVKLTGIRINRVQFNCVGGQDGYFAADAPSPEWGGGNPTNNMVVTFTENDFDLGNNFSSYGWALGNGRETSSDLIRLYKKASSSIWPAQFQGIVTLDSTAFFQYDSTQLETGRYIYYYESDSASEYNNIIDYIIWLR